MIETELVFHTGTFRQVARALLSLPKGLRPTHHSLGEDETGLPIDDPVAFASSVEEQPPGPFLTGPCCSFHFSLASPRPLICRGDLDVAPDLAKRFMLEMAGIKPIFGFACTSEERYQRNRITLRQGVNTIESWVGRDTEKYVPGFYWLTLLSDALAKQHDISIDSVKAVVLEHIELEGGQHLFRFFDRPEDWQSAIALNRLCTSMSGVFNLERVKTQLSGAQTFLELNAVLRAWR